MSSYGYVVSRPEVTHKCAPGWTEIPAVTDPRAVDLMPVPPGMRSVAPPIASDYPKGTVWQCSCGRSWICVGPPNGRSAGSVSFRPERRLERRRRLRRLAK